MYMNQIIYKLLTKEFTGTWTEII